MCFFPKNFQYFATFPPPALGSYWLYRKWPANKSDWTLRSKIRWVALLYAGDGLQWIGKNTIFNERPANDIVYWSFTYIVLQTMLSNILTDRLVSKNNPFFIVFFRVCDNFHFICSENNLFSHSYPKSYTLLTSYLCQG